MKTGLNIAVVFLLPVFIGIKTHVFEQWLIDASLHKLGIVNFGSSYTIELIRWLPTMLVGLIVGVIVTLVVFGNKKMWWALLAALFLVMFSFYIRKSVWYVEPSTMMNVIIEMRHFMYLLGAFIGVFITRSINSQLTNHSSMPAKNAGGTR